MVSLTMASNITKGPLAITTYCDLDWASNLDDRRSTTGFGIYLGSNVISWFAKK
jgi:hypothetical protein